MLVNIDHTINNVDFSGYTEPLYNPNWFEIFSHTIEENYAVTLYSTLGRASWDDLDKLTGLAFHQIYVHLLDSVAQRDKLAFLIDRCRALHRDLIFVYFDEDGRELASEFQGHVNCERWTAHSRAGLVDVGKVYVPGAVSCSEQREFCHVVLPNGDVYICCMDFSLQHKIGNLLESRLAEIQYSEKALAFRATMASATDGMCNHCICAVPVGEVAAS
jgi:radical SAM protein with 4Fe4S-binding SPASM domain